MSSGSQALSPEGHRWPVTLRHGPIVLRPLGRRDRRDWEAVRARNWEWLRQWEATPPPGPTSGPRSFAQLTRLLTRQAREERCLPWVISYDVSEGTDRAAVVPLIGQLTVSGITLGSARWGQIGYWIDQRFAGQGIVPTAVALATDYAFSSMRLHRMEIAIRPENDKSLRVVHKLGFRPEGSRPRYLHIDGDWRDHLIFALNHEEVPEGLLNRYLDGGPQQSSDTPPGVADGGRSST